MLPSVIHQGCRAGKYLPTSVHTARAQARLIPAYAHRSRSICLSEGVEQSGEESSFVFHHRSAVTALSAPEPGIEQIPEGVAKHVEGVDDNRQEKPRPQG